MLAKDLIPSTSLTENSWQQDWAQNDEKTIGKAIVFLMILMRGLVDGNAPGGVYDLPLVDRRQSTSETRCLVHLHGGLPSYTPACPVAGPYGPPDRATL